MTDQDFLKTMQLVAQASKQKNLLELKVKAADFRRLVGMAETFRLVPLSEDQDFKRCLKLEIFMETLLGAWEEIPESEKDKLWLIEKTGKLASLFEALKGLMTEEDLEASTVSQAGQEVGDFEANTHDRGWGKDKGQ